MDSSDRLYSSTIGEQSLETRSFLMLRFCIELKVIFIYDPNRLFHVQKVIPDSRVIQSRTSRHNLYSLIQKRKGHVKLRKSARKY